MIRKGKKYTGERETGVSQEMENENEKAMRRENEALIVRKKKKEQDGKRRKRGSMSRGSSWRGSL